MAAPVWFKVRKELGRQPIVAGRIPGSSPLFVERYIYQDIERTVSGMDTTALVVQFGGGRVREGEPHRWRSMNLPTQSLLMSCPMWWWPTSVLFQIPILSDLVALEWCSTPQHWGIGVWNHGMRRAVAV